MLTRIPMKPDDDPQLELVERFFGGTGSTYDFMVHATTFGIDRLWKRRIVAKIPPQAGRILDLACGTGISTLAIAKRFPQAQVVGVDLREEYLAIARQKLASLSLTNVEFVRCRAEDYRSEQPFDSVVSSYLAKYAQLDRMTSVTKSLLSDGGLLLMHDFTFPPKASLVRIWRLYFWLLQRVGTPLYPTWKEIFYGLPRLIEQTRWVDELRAALERHAFRDISMEYLTLYGSAIMTGRK